MTPGVIRERAVALPHGITLHCREAGGAGAEGGPRVLLLHGFPEGAFAWDEVLTALAPRARLLAPDQRGYGRSSRPASVADYRAKALGADLIALIEAFTAPEGGPLDLLVAHDWGGAVAWNLAAARPDLMRRLLIINSPHPATFLRELRDNPAQQAASRYMNEFQAADCAQRLAADDFAALWPFLEGDWLTPAWRERFRDAWRDGLDPALNWYRASPLRPPVDGDDAVRTLALPDALTRVSVPTTVLWGEADHALLPGLLDGLPQWVPHLDLRRVPGASHWIVHERPALVTQTIAGLLGC